MPLYEYQCKQCQRRTEKIQKFSDPELTTCPFCAGELERTLTAPAVHFAGSGWYKDLYSSAKPPAPNAENSGAAAPATSDGASSGTGEARSAAASPSAAGSPSTAPSTPAPSSSASTNAG